MKLSRTTLGFLGGCLVFIFLLSINFVLVKLGFADYFILFPALLVGMLIWDAFSPNCPNPLTGPGDLEHYDLTLACPAVGPVEFWLLAVIVTMLFCGFIGMSIIYLTKRQKISLSPNL